MESTIKTLALCALLASAAHADVTVTVQASSPWSGYMNVFNLPANGGGFSFGDHWGVNNLRAVFSGSSLTLSPNTISDPDAFWYTPAGGPGAAGNKIMEANLSVQTPAGLYSGQTMTFTGIVTANTLTAAHTSVAFIKDFAPDYSSAVTRTVALAPGPFSISLALNPDPTRHVQYGFQTIGVNVWATDVAPFGNVQIAANHVPPSPPLALADAVTLHRNQKALVPVTANDTGLLTPGTVTITTPPLFGTATPDGLGRVLYTHTSGSPASDSFAYSVSGPGGGPSSAVVTVTFANQLRIAPGPLNVPSTPPATNIAIVDAFPSLTFSQPVTLASPPGDTRRLFVVEKTGAIRVIQDVTAPAPVISNFLNLTVLTDSECGLLGLAFHPNYAVNRYFYVFYSVGPSGTTIQRVSRFTADATNPNLAVPGSELVLIQQSDEATNHNGGDLHFGPDGYLYITLGDEGGQDDFYNNSQRIDGDFFSGILRIDVDKRSGNLAPTAHPAIPLDAGIARYSIPANNPWVAATTFNGAAINTAARRAEFWAVGLRNPWRISFDSQPPHEMWIGDVGGGQREEINLGVSGGNFGWAFREGTVNGPKSGSTPSGFTSLAPLYSYNHGTGTLEGRSVTGGVVARNNRFSALVDRYFFADYVSGNVWSLVRNPSVQVQRIAGAGGIAGFGFDPSNRDVLMANISQNRIQRLVSSDGTGSFPQTLSETRLFADLTDLSPAPGVLPYKVNRPFWSDHADKRRWFVLPDPTARFTWSQEGTWGAPAGAVWVKHFDMEMVRGNPATQKRLETRLLVRNAAGSYGVSYRWNEAGTEATLVADEGVSFPLDVVDNGVVTPRTWSIPSRASCISCHNPAAGHMLSFKTRQLNEENSINGFSGNQIDLLAQAAYFDAAVPPGNTLPRHLRPSETAMDVGSHVRSYLEVNCAYCHMPGGPAPSNWDAREVTPLALTGLINGIANNPGVNPLNRLVVPGNNSLSILPHRVAATNGFGRMPPIASNVVDTVSVAQIQQWISTSLPARQDYAAWRVSKFQSPDSNAGERTANPDGDNSTNETEFLIGTEPNSGASFPNSQITSAGNTLTVSLNLPANRIAWIETSTDLVTWSRWNVPGNNGLPGLAGLRTFTGSLALPTQFFRPVVMED